MPKITARFVRDVKPDESDRWYWDDQLKGFALRVRPTGATFYVRYRPLNAAWRKHCLGPAAAIGADAARARAAEIIASARVGVDLVAAAIGARKSPTVRDLFERHHGELHRPPAITAGTYRNRAVSWTRHILPALAERRVADLTWESVLAWFRGIPDPTAANAALATLSTALTDCERFTPGWRPHNSNPCAGIPRNRTRARDRVLEPAELTRFLETLDAMCVTGEIRPALADLFLLTLLLGTRKMELASRRWDDLDLSAGTLTVPETKNGKPRAIRLGPIALETLRRRRADPAAASSDWIFPAPGGEKHVSSLAYPWSKVLARAGLEDFRIHDLRHVAASLAMIEGGLSLREVSAMIGHASIQSTARYLNMTLQRAQKVHAQAEGAILGRPKPAAIPE